MIKTIRRKWIKKILIFIGIIPVVVFCFFLALYIQIDFDVKEKISIAKQKYPGKAEDALIAYLLDENNSTNSRTHLAIWTLGQIQSKKALPVLYKLYKNDPKGKTCHGKHDEVICQYAIHTAIDCIEKEYSSSHKRLNK